MTAKKRNKTHFTGTPVKTTDGLYGTEQTPFTKSVPYPVMNRVIRMIIDEADKAGLSDKDKAYVLAFVNCPESGFNPSAASRNSTAVGVFQLIDATRHFYHIPDDKKWDARLNIQAGIQYYIKAREAARKKGLPEEFYYAYFHDGANTRDILHGNRKDKNNPRGIDLSRTEVMPGVPAWAEFLKRWNSGLEVGYIDNYSRDSKHRRSFVIKVGRSSSGFAAPFAIGSHDGKLTVSQGGITTFKDIHTGATTANIPGMGEGLKVAPTGLIHVGGLGIRLPLNASDDMGGVYVNGRKLADIPYGNSVTSNGTSVIVLDGRKGNAPARMVLPDGGVAEFEYGADGNISGINAAGLKEEGRYTVALQPQPGGGYSIVTADSQTRATTRDSYAANNTLASSKTEHADHTSRSYSYNGAHMASQADFDGERTTTRTYTLAGADVSSLSKEEVANPDGSHVTTTYTVRPENGTSKPKEEVYTNTDGSTSTTTYRGERVSKVVARNSKGHDTSIAIYHADGSVKVLNYDTPGGKTTSVYGADGSVEIKSPAAHGGKGTSGMHKAEMGGELLPEGAQERSAADEVAQQEYAFSEMRFNPDASGSRLVTQPDGSVTEKSFGALEGYVLLADNYDTLSEVVSYAPKRFALDYTSRMLRKSQQRPAGAMQTDPSAQSMSETVPADVPATQSTSGISIEAGQSMQA